MVRSGCAFVGVLRDCVWWVGDNLVKPLFVRGLYISTQTSRARLVALLACVALFAGGLSAFVTCFSPESDFSSAALSSCGFVNSGNSTSESLNHTSNSRTNCGNSREEKYEWWHWMTGGWVKGACMAGTWAWSIALFVFSLEKPLWKCATCFRQCVVCLGTPYYHSRDQDIDLELTDQDDEYSVQEISRRVGRTKAVLYTLCALPLIMEWSTLLGGILLVLSAVLRFVHPLRH